MISWELRARELVNCNCAYGCPCQFNALPTHGHCEAVGGYEIVRGHFGDVRLDGLRAVSVLKWPGPIHHGGGEALTIIDERASEAQRRALLTIMAGEETEPGKTVWNVFASTIDTVHDPLFLPIDIRVDIDARRGHILVDGLVKVVGEPIRNPVNGLEHRVRIDIPDGFEYRLAEMGSASAFVTGPIPLKLDQSYAQFAEIHLNHNGVVHPMRS